MLSRGAAVTGVECGPERAALAQLNLAHFPDWEMCVSSIEDWTLPAQPCEAVVSATAFHWVDKAPKRIGRSGRPACWWPYTPTRL